MSILIYTSETSLKMTKPVFIPSRRAVDQMRKEFAPKDMQDLEDVFFDPARQKDKEKWESYAQNTLSDFREKDIPRIFGVFGNCKKIPESREKKTFDYEIHESRLLLEVTTIDLPSGTTQINMDEERLIAKIKRAVKHIEEKDYSEYPHHTRGGVIYYNSILGPLTNIWDVLEKDSVRNIIKSSGVDYVVFITAEASTSSNYPIEVNTPLTYVKKDAGTDLFRRKLPAAYRIREIDS